jgi:transposase
MNQITTVGVDLAKDVIVVCAGDASGHTLYFRQFSFHGFGQWAANLPPCTFGMEACSSAHYWARRLSELGHTPRLMAAEFVETVPQEPRRQERPQRCSSDLECGA